MWVINIIIENILEHWTNHLFMADKQKQGQFLEWQTEKKFGSNKYVIMKNSGYWTTTTTTNNVMQCDPFKIFFLVFFHRYFSNSQTHKQWLWHHHINKQQQQQQLLFLTEIKYIPADTHTHKRNESNRTSMIQIGLHVLFRLFLFLLLFAACYCYFGA